MEMEEGSSRNPMINEKDLSLKEAGRFGVTTETLVRRMKPPVYQCFRRPVFRIPAPGLQARIIPG